MATAVQNARGRRGERIAAQHLTRSGYRVIERNFRTRSGELDIVAEGSGCLVFCEVKTLVAGGRAGPPTPLESIGPEKRRRLRRMALEWLDAHARGDRPRQRLRFDAIGVTLTRAGAPLAVEHIEGAF